MEIQNGRLISKALHFILNKYKSRTNQNLSSSNPHIINSDKKCYGENQYTVSINT
jgi:hypothetical protein